MLLGILLSIKFLLVSNWKLATFLEVSVLYFKISLFVDTRGHIELQ